MPLADQNFKTKYEYFSLVRVNIDSVHYLSTPINSFFSAYGMEGVCRRPSTTHLTSLGLHQSGIASLVDSS